MLMGVRFVGKIFVFRTAPHANGDSGYDIHSSYLGPGFGISYNSNGGQNQNSHLNLDFASNM